MNFSNATVLENTDISYLENILIGTDGLMRTIAFADVRDFSQNDISVFCLKYGIYQIITDELVEFVGNEIGELPAIEIGAGNGCLGRALGIPLTDSKIQEDAQLQKFYKSIGQPPVIYPPDVKKLDALVAVKVLRAEAAVGSWVTHKFKRHLKDGFFGGVDEMILSKRLKKYIFIGNAHTHRHKEMLRFCNPVEYRFEWLISRSLNRAANIIWVFNF